MDFILTMHELSKRYRHFQALDKLTMHIPKRFDLRLDRPERGGKNNADPDDCRTSAARTRVSIASTA